MSRDATPREPPRHAGMLPPHDLDAEGDLLGHLIEHGSDVALAAGIVDSADFFSDRHEIIARALFALDELIRASGRSDVKITDGLVLSWIKDRGLCARVGGRGSADPADARRYLIELVDKRPAITSQVEVVAGRIADKARVRRAISLLWELLAEAYADYGDDAQAWLDGAAGKLAAVSRRRARAELGTIGAALPRALGHLTNAGKLVGLSTGLDGLDEKTGGLQRSTLYMVTGPTGGGKTAFALGLGLDVSSAVDADGRRRSGVYLWSGEMPREQLTLRAACREMRVSYHTANNHPADLALDDRIALEQASGLLDGLPLIIDDRKSLSPEQLRGAAHRAKERFEQDGAELALIVGDYFQLTGPPRGMRRNASRAEELNTTGLALIALAEELRIPVVLLAQLRADGEIAECTGMKRHIHCWFDLKGTKPSKARPRGEPVGCSIKINKLRNGPPGERVALWFHRDFQLFSEAERLT